MAYKEQSPIPIVEGGTNAQTFSTTDGVIYFDGTRLVTTGAGTTGQVLTSNAPAAPTFQNAAGTGKGVFGTSTLIVSGGGAGATQWQSPFMSGTLNGVQNLAQFVCPSAGIVSNLYVLCSQNTQGTPVTVTFNVNSVATAMTVTIPGGTTGIFTDLVHNISVSAGDLIQWATVGSAGGQVQAAYSVVFKI